MSYIYLMSIFVLCIPSTCETASLHNLRINREKALDITIGSTVLYCIGVWCSP